MDDGINHILNTNGILKNFSISKCISAKELSIIKKQVESECSDKDDFNKLLNEKLIQYTDEYIKKNRIPGLIINKKTGIKNFKIKNKNFMKLYRESVFNAQKLTLEKKLNKEELLFYIISMIGYLGLTQQDFAQFSKDLSESPDFEEDENLDDEDDESDDGFNYEQ